MKIEILSNIEKKKFIMRIKNLKILIISKKNLIKKRLVEIKIKMNYKIL